MKYILVKERQTKDLEVSVCNMMDRGYTPLGGPYAVPTKKAHADVIGHLHIQAMVFSTPTQMEPK